MSVSSGGGSWASEVRAPSSRLACYARDPAARPETPPTPPALDAALAAHSAFSSPTPLPPPSSPPSSRPSPFPSRPAVLLRALLGVRFRRPLPHRPPPRRASRLERLERARRAVRVGRAHRRAPRAGSPPRVRAEALLVVRARDVPRAGRGGLLAPPRDVPVRRVRAQDAPVPPRGCDAHARGRADWDEDLCLVHRGVLPRWPRDARDEGGRARAPRPRRAVFVVPRPRETRARGGDAQGRRGVFVRPVRAMHDAMRRVREAARTRYIYTRQFFASRT